MFGVLLGFPVLRLRGDYLAIVTLAFGEMIRILFMFLILISSCGKKGRLSLDENELQRERIINQERVYKF